MRLCQFAVKLPLSKCWMTNARTPKITPVMQLLPLLPLQTIIRHRLQLETYMPGIVF